MQTLIHGFRWLFSTTLPAGRLFGIPLRVHLLLVLLAPFLGIWAFQFGAALVESVWGGVLALALYVGVLYGSVVAHEFGHAWGHRLVGGETEVVYLTPVGGICMGTGGLESPRTELIVVALGPAVTAVLAAVAWIVRMLLPEPTNTAMQFVAFSVWMLEVTNVGLLLFNLFFPLFPMDGARLLRAALSLKYSPGVVTQRVCQVGIAVGVVLLIGMFIDISLPYFGKVSGLLWIIGMLGIMSCLNEMERIKHMGVYVRSDTWGQRVVYYDQEILAGAKARATQDVGGLLKRRAKSPARARAARSPARVIEIAPPPPIDEIDDIVELRRLMKRAADDEDFPLAARIKKRLKEVAQDE